jgi:hypothetical protein
LQNAGNSAYSSAFSGWLLSEDRLWSGDAVSHAYNNRLRSTMTLDLPGGSGLTANFGHDAGKRLTNITSWAGKPHRSQEIS